MQSDVTNKKVRKWAVDIKRIPFEISDHRLFRYLLPLVRRYIIPHTTILELFGKSIFKHVFVNFIPQNTSFYFDSTIAELHSSIGRYKLILNIKTVFPYLGIPMFKIRRSRDRLIFNIGDPYTGKTTFFILRRPPKRLSPRKGNHQERRNHRDVEHSTFLMQNYYFGNNMILYCAIKSILLDSITRVIAVFVDGARPSETIIMT